MRIARLRLQNEADRLVGCATGERWMTSEQLIEDGAEPVNIGRARELRDVSGGLLGRDVTRGSQDVAGLRDRAFRFHQARQPEVGQMRFALDVEQNISRLDIAMNDSALMRVVRGAGEARDDLHRAPQRQRFAPNELIELSAFDELHAVKAGAVVFADIVDRHDPRVLQTGGRLGFAAETFQMRLARPMSQPDNLQRHEPVQAFLARAIDHALTAAAYFLE